MKKKILYFIIASFLFGAPLSAALVPNDFYYVNQWYLSKIKADKAWEKISTSPDVIIAVIDSGIDIKHPDLVKNIWVNEREMDASGKDDDNNGFIDDKYGWDFVNNVPDPSPKFIEAWTESGISHGTLIAGIIAATGNNSQGISGVTWEAKIMALKAFNDRGEGRISDIVRAIDYAINNGAHIINLSFMNLDYSASLQEAIARAHRAGLIIVAAAGNELGGGQGYNTREKPVYPACYDGKLIGENMVIGVAATDALDQKANFSAYGENCIDISAPGISFFGAITRGGNLNDSELIYDGYWSGTSMAAPLVSGALALIMQANPELSRQEVVSILFASSDDISKLNPGYPNQLGNGRLNLDRAIEMAKEKLYSRLGLLLVRPDKSEILDKDGKKKEASFRGPNGTLSLTAKTEIFSGFLDLKAADLNGDGNFELVLGAEPGAEPKIKIMTYDGRLKKEFLAYDKNFRGGISLALGDVDGDGKIDIIVGAKTEGNGRLKIFDQQGNLKKEINAYDRNFKGELVLAVGNIDGKGADEIVLGFGAGAKASIRILSGAGKLIGAFFAYDKNYLGGVELEVANLDGLKDGGKAEIIVLPKNGIMTEVKIFNNKAKLLNSFPAFLRTYKNGANLSVGDLNNDGILEIIVSARAGLENAPHVRVFNFKGIIMESFYAWEAGYNGGVRATALKIKN